MTSLKELQELVSNQIPESLYLEYKRSAALKAGVRRELSKDVSAFANADGGLIVYGVEEVENLPKALDEGSAASDISRETIEQLLTTNIAPRIEGIEISQIDAPSGNAYFTIRIPKSFRAPHQDRATNKYYRRLNFMAVAMEDYELADLRGRARLAEPLVAFEVETRHGVLFLFRIANRGSVTAEEVTFEFVPALTWQDKGPPGVITNGIQHLPPGREYVVFYHPIPDALGQDSGVCTEFTVNVSYFHPTARSRVAEAHQINLRDYLGTWSPYSPVDELSTKVEKGLQEVSKGLKSIADRLDAASSATSGTGIRISVSTLRAFSLLLSGANPVQKLDPQGLEHTVFQEVLDVPVDVASKISRHFRRSR